MTINGGVTREDALSSVGAGWAGLVNQIYDLAEPQFKTDFDNWAGITQVKEKFGGLTVYTYGLGEEIDKHIDGLCEKSYTVCEVCGEIGQVRDLKSWYKTLCEWHYKERRKAMRS